MDQNSVQKGDIPQFLRLEDISVSREIGEGLINAVITAAVWSEELKPGRWQKMLEAVNRGAEKTREGTAGAFFFQAMVDRLLEEFHGLELK